LRARFSLWHGHRLAPPNTGAAIILADGTTTLPSAEPHACDR
jgi:hypothetical protein